MLGVASHIQGSQFDPELGLLSVWSFACPPGLHVASPVSSHHEKDI